MGRLPTHASIGRPFAAEILMVVGTGARAVRCSEIAPTARRLETGFPGFATRFGCRGSRLLFAGNGFLRLDRLERRGKR